MTPTALTLDEALTALSHPGAWIVVCMVLGSVALAWLLVRLMQGRVPPDRSVWFGRRIVDGALFPVASLVLAYAAERIARAHGLPLAVFKIAIPVLLSFALIRVSVRVLREAFPESPLVKASERTISWLAWGAMVGWITGVLPELLGELDEIHWKFGSSAVSVRTLLEGALSAGVVLMLALWVSAAIEARLLKGAQGEQLSLRKAAANAVRALLIFIGLLMALSAVGIDLTALSVMGGAIGVGVGMGLQRLAANYVSGFVILAERSLRIGDMVRVDGFEGRVSDIAGRYTVIRSITGRESILPNEMLTTQRVENFSLADPKVLLSTTVQVAYGTDLDALFPALVAQVVAVPRVLSEPGPSVLLSSFAADGLELQVNFWIIDPENGNGGVRSDVNLAIWRYLNQAQVEVPFPQRVLHWAPSPHAGSGIAPAGDGGAASQRQSAP